MVIIPKKGEPLQDIRPGIDYASLPADRACPVCFCVHGQGQKKE
ncbi:rubredoxin [Methanoregula sp.]